MKKVATLFFAVGLTTASISCNDRKPPARAGAPNVLFVVIDTLRADRLGCYGNSLGLTPRLDAVSKQGAIFKNAFSHAPWTMPSFASMLTSTLPREHKAGGNIRDEHFTRMSDSVMTLPEKMLAQHYDTGAIVNVLFLEERFGFKRGFEHYDYHRSDNNLGKRTADQTSDAAILWMKSHQDRPFFLMVHYFDCHLVYDPPAKFRQKFADKRDWTTDPKLFGKAQEMRDLHAGKIAMSDVPIDRLEKLYNAETAFVDEQVGRVLDELDRMGKSQNTVVIVTADHGEEFRDHGGFEHGHTMYDELLHVPLIVRYPAAVKPCNVETTVRHIDLAPTILDLAGVDAEPRFAGKSLVGVMADAQSKDRVVVSEGGLWGPLMTSLRDSGFKLIEKINGRELYNVKLDSGEREDLAKTTRYRDRQDRMSAELDAIQKAAELRGNGQNLNVALDANARRSLESVGYAMGGKGAEKRPTTSAPVSSQPTGNR